MNHAESVAMNPGAGDATVPAAPRGKPKAGKKTADPGEASKLVAARISQLEQEHVGEREQEAEIGACTCGKVWPNHPVPPIF